VIAGDEALGPVVPRFICGLRRSRRAGGLAGALGIGNRQRRANAAGCAGGQLAGAPVCRRRPPLPGAEPDLDLRVASADSCLRATSGSALGERVPMESGEEGDSS
jgi:hypothetical protein